MEEKEWVKRPLSAKQQEIYAYVAGYIEDNLKFEGKPIAPTRREIVDKLGISEQAVSAHLKEIKNKGWIRFTDGGWRNIELIPKQ